VLLRETLKQQRKVGIARVVIRTREHLTMLMPKGEALMLMVLRYPQELVSPDAYSFPDKAVKTYRVSPKEIEMASHLVESMSSPWDPKAYRDEFREKLAKMVELRVKKKGGRVKVKGTEPALERSGKVVDFMSLLKKSIDSNRRTPARQAPAKKAAVRKKTQKTA
jgi:DNA end-binding protein Ku